MRQFRIGDKVLIDNLNRYDGDCGVNNVMSGWLRNKTVLEIRSITTRRRAIIYDVGELNNVGNSWSFHGQWLKHYKKIKEVHTLEDVEKASLIIKDGYVFSCWRSEDLAKELADDTEKEYLTLTFED